MVSLYLKKDEIYFLISKYQKSGMTRFEASKRIDKLKDDLHSLVIKLKSKNKSDDFINEKFKQAFYEECQKADGLF